MKKYLLLSFILFTSNSIFAQADEIAGNWSEIMRIRIDTTTSGIEEMRKDWEAYKKGNKKLDPEYTDESIMFPREYDKLKLTIKKEGALFTATNGSHFNEKISYSSEFENYRITIKGYLGESRIFNVKYDFSMEKLLFLDDYGRIYYAFERKK